MTTDTREALTALAEIEGWFEKREAIAGDLGALDEQLEMAGLAGRVAGIRAALAIQPAQPSAQGEAVARITGINDRFGAVDWTLHQGAPLKIGDYLYASPTAQPSCLKEDEC